MIEILVTCSACGRKWTYKVPHGATYVRPDSPPYHLRRNMSSDSPNTTYAPCPGGPNVPEEVV